MGAQGLVLMKACAPGSEPGWPSLTLPFPLLMLRWAHPPAHHPQQQAPSLEETPAASKPPSNSSRPNSCRDLTQRPMGQFKPPASQTPGNLRSLSVCVHLEGHFEDRAVKK